MSDIPVIPTQAIQEEDDYYATYFPDPTKESQQHTNTESIENSATPPELPDEYSTTTLETIDTANTLTSSEANTVQQSIVQQVYEEIGEDTKFVRLTTVTTIVHSIIFLIYIGFNAMRMLPNNSKDNESMMTLITNLTTLFQ